MICHIRNKNGTLSVKTNFVQEPIFQKMPFFGRGDEIVPVMASHPQNHPHLIPRNIKRIHSTNKNGTLLQFFLKIQIFVPRFLEDYHSLTYFGPLIPWCLGKFFGPYFLVMMIFCLILHLQ